MLQILTKLFDTNAKELKKLWPIVAQINTYESEFKKLKKSDFKAKTAEFKLRLEKGETLDDLLPEAFALVREASTRTLDLRHYDVQLIAGIAFHQGKIAEQKTGEGKTLSATLALYLNSLAGLGAHLITVNDYLAQRDAGWNSPMFDLLGVSVGVIIHDQAFIYNSNYQGQQRGDSRLEHSEPITRKEAYTADITYGTSNEFGFDYLRDNMAPALDQIVQRGHHFAIVDEVDSVLIDEARTPLIISAPDTEPTEKYVRFASMVQELVRDSDYDLDEKLRTATLTDYGVKKLETHLGIDNLYEKDYDTIHHIEQALKAHSLFRKDRDYVVKDGQVIIVDEHTGRLMHGRRYSDGLHQAIEAKEAVPIQKESRTLATVSIQNYFRMYHKLAGMTGTAETEAEEFKKIYNVDVLIVPTNRPVVRTDHKDQVYKTTRAKYAAIVREITTLHHTGQPVLIGTRSIEHNDIVENFLKKKNIPHQVLNAKNHEREAHIIAGAGSPGAVTVATNIAGRGVDIVLGGAPPEKPDPKAPKKDQAVYQNAHQIWQEKHQKVLDFGGLHVIGTERHESRRIDNQLRGRSGRQGDPGSSRFYVSLEDDIMRIFGGERVAGLMTALKIPEDQPIEASLVSRAIEQAQGKVEGFHFDQRKHLVEYDDVLNKQREIIYQRRRHILETAEADTGLEDKILDTVNQEIQLIVGARALEGLTDEEISAIIKEFITIIPFDDKSGQNLQKALKIDPNPDKIIRKLQKIATDLYQQRKQNIGQKAFSQLERWTILKTIDDLWIDHLDNIDSLRDGIWLRGDKDSALSAYKKEAFDLFESLINTVNSQVARRIFRVQFTAPTSNSQVVQTKHQEEPKTAKEPARATIAAATGNPFAAALSKAKAVSPNAPSAHKKIGRNDPCPCGAINPKTGQPYKYKKCGLIGAPYHQG